MERKVDKAQCNCAAIRDAMGSAGDLIGGHEPDCVCTNGIVDLNYDRLAELERRVDELECKTGTLL